MLCEVLLLLFSSVCGMSLLLPSVESGTAVAVAVAGAAAMVIGTTI